MMDWTKRNEDLVDRLLADGLAVEDAVQILAQERVYRKAYRLGRAHAEQEHRQDVIAHAQRESGTRLPRPTGPEL